MANEWRTSQIDGREGKGLSAAQRDMMHTLESKGELEMRHSVTLDVLVERGFVEWKQAPRYMHGRFRLTDSGRAYMEVFYAEVYL